MNFRTAAMLSVFVHASSHGAEDPNLTRCVEQSAADIKELVDISQWTISSAPTSIVIESKFEMTEHRIVSPALGQEEPRTTKYRIELQFKPKLSKEDFLKLAKQRMEHVVMLRYGATSKAEWAQAAKFLKDHPLPRYDTIDVVGKSYSVYLISNDLSSITLRPIERYAEAKGVEARIDHVFWPLAN
ncbi:MAG: hypothetical protein EOP83_21165 [Verrucomicrobiaceae bacterium]|nr:MAG: hypothetical protein EOP83_21165 [Verrucomicrobiaceae bacterium]